MILDTINLSDLDDLAGYCVIRDAHKRESIIASGRKIKMLLEGDLKNTEYLSASDFQRFKPAESLGLPDYVRVDVDGDQHIGIWLDPTRPELQAGETERRNNVIAVSQVNALRAAPPSLIELLSDHRRLLALCFN